MKRLVTIFAVLSLAGVSFAVPTVTSPPVAPGWWNEDSQLYAYAWWSADIIAGGTVVSPPDNPSHWASNYIDNTDFGASIGLTDESVSVELLNEYHPDLYKKIYIYITGTVDNTTQNVDTILHTGTGIFNGTQTWSIGMDGLWTFLLEGEIRPQPQFVSLLFGGHGMKTVTNIWVGESAQPIAVVPVPGAVILAGIGVSLVGWTKRRKSML